MRIAILVTNTDRSAFAARHPRDGEKFRALFAQVRPDWRLEVFDLTQGDFPKDIRDFDGIVIGGSPASVHDQASWIASLMDLIRRAHRAGVPMAGACFGHQAIALALGGTVDDNPGGWVFGATETPITAPAPWMETAPAPIRLAAAHSEQVTQPPPGAVIIGGTPACPVGCYRIGQTVFAIQHHPEITGDFLAGLVAEYAPKLPPDVAHAAQGSLGKGLEGARYGEWMARFFEGARG